MPRSTSKSYGRATGATSPIPSSPGPLFRSPSPRRSSSKRARSKSPPRPPPRRDVRRRVRFEEGADVEKGATSPISDESVVDGSDHIGGPRVDTPGAARSGGGGRAPELSLELFNSLQHVDDPLMQQLGSFLSSSIAETADLCRRLAASEEKVTIN